MSLEEIHSTILKKFNLYKMYQRYLLQFQNIRFILKVSLEKTLSTIPQNLICIKNCENDFKAKDVSLQHKFEIFYYVWKLWKVSQYKPNFFKIMEGVSSRDTFNIIPFFWELWKMSLDTFHNFKKIGFILKVSLQKTLFTISIQTVENF